MLLCTDDVDTQRIVNTLPPTVSKEGSRKIGKSCIDRGRARGNSSDSRVRLPADDPSHIPHASRRGKAVVQIGTSDESSAYERRFIKFDVV